MYARMVQFAVESGMRSMAKTLIGGANTLYNNLKGFKHVTYFGDEAVGEYGAFSLWESKEDAEDADIALNPKLEEALDGVSNGPPKSQLFEVIEPKASLIGTPIA